MSWNDSVLRVMLDKLSKTEIIDLLIGNLKIAYGEEEDLKKITHAIVCYVQCEEINAGREQLENYQEPHRKELFTRLMPTILRTEINEKAVDLLYNDYKNSKLNFQQWRKTI